MCSYIRTSLDIKGGEIRMACRFPVRIVYWLDTMIHNLRISFTIDYLGRMLWIIFPIPEPCFEFLGVYRIILFLCPIAFQGFVDIV